MYCQILKEHAMNSFTICGLPAPVYVAMKMSYAQVMDDFGKFTCLKERIYGIYARKVTVHIFLDYFSSCCLNFTRFPWGTKQVLKIASYFVCLYRVGGV